MPRNLDLTALRSFVTVAETGGVTRAAGLLHVTQSAVSMQLKRLEEALGQRLLDRSQRAVSLTAAGEQLFSYARRMLDLNDQAMRLMTDAAFEGEINLGVPHDIIYPAIPEVLQRFASEFPRMRVHLVSAYTRQLKASFAHGDFDFILTTEDGSDIGGIELASKPLVWIGADGGTIWRERPLRLAFCRNCIFRAGVVRQLDLEGIEWEMTVISDSDRTIEATVSADLAVNAVIEGTEPSHTRVIPHGGALPTLGNQQINLYRAESAKGPAQDAMEELIRTQFASF